MQTHREQTKSLFQDQTFRLINNQADRRTAAPLPHSLFRPQYTVLYTVMYIRASPAEIQKRRGVIEGLGSPPPTLIKKENQIFLIYTEIQSGAVAKS